MEGGFMKSCERNSKSDKKTWNSQNDTFLKKYQY